MLNPLPVAVWALALPIAGVELLLSLAQAGLVNWPGSTGWREAAVLRFGITPALQDWMIGSATYPLEHLARYLAFGAVHLGPAQATLVVAIVAGLGTVSAGALGSLRVILFALAGQIAGAVTFGALAEDGAFLVGGYPLIFALAGIYAAVEWHNGKGARAFGVLGTLIVGRLAIAALMGGNDVWADLAAAFISFALALALRPGLLARLRRR